MSNFNILKKISFFKKIRDKRLWYFNNLKTNFLTIGKKNNAGRSKFGKILVHSKGSLKKKTLYKVVTNSLKGLKYLSTITKIEINSLKSKMLALFVNSIGCWFFTLLVSKLFLFDFIKIFNNKLSVGVIIYYNFWPRHIRDFKPHTSICFIELIDNKGKASGVKFAKSSGTGALLISNIYKEYFSIIILPSLKVKIIYNKSIAFVNYISNQYQLYFKKKKAGYYVNKGKKPTVRGTVKNSCDHPNGGRNRSLRLSRTPWGKVAKKSRSVSEVKNLKSLFKRSLRKKNKENARYIPNFFENKELTRKLLDITKL